MQPVELDWLQVCTSSGTLESYDPPYGSNVDVTRDGSDVVVVTVREVVDPSYAITAHGGGTPVAVTRYSGGVCTEIASIDVDFGHGGAARSIGVSGDKIIIGAAHGWAAGGQMGDGIVYIYSTDGSLIQTLTSSVGYNYEYFGLGVDIDGDAAAIASYLGKIFIYRESGGTWAEEQVLDVQNAVIWNLALDGDTLAAANLGIGANGGTVSIYRYSGGTWSLEQEISPPGDFHPVVHRFGVSVDLHGDLLIVGADLEKCAIIYRFNGSTWEEEQRFCYTGTSWYYGRSVAIYDDFAIIGMPNNGYNPYEGSKVEVYEYDGSEWVLDFTRTGYGYLGYSVAVTEDAFVIGEPRASGEYIAGVGTLPARPGYMHLYTR